jgi:hypothetical protein
MNSREEKNLLKDKGDEKVDDPEIQDIGSLWNWFKHLIF